MLTSRTDTMMVWMVAEMTAAEESKLACTLAVGLEHRCVRVI